MTVTTVLAGAVLAAVAVSVCGSVARAQTPAASPATAARFEKIGQPCRSFNVLAARVVTTPDGRELFVLSNMQETTAGELVFVDVKANTGKAYTAPAGKGGWALMEVPGKRVVQGTFYDGTFNVFDLNRMDWITKSKIPGEDYIWSFAIGSDGRLYGGTYKHAKLAALDLGTYAVEAFDNPTDAANLYLRQTSALPDGRILCTFASAKLATKLFDPATKKWQDVPETMKHVQTGVVWNGYFLAGNTWDGKAIEGAVAFDGNDLTPVAPPPFPVPSGDEKWNVLTTPTTADTLFLKQGDKFYRYRKGDAGLTLVAEQDLKGTTPSAATADGALLGVRGGEYYVLREGQTKLDLRPIPVEPGPRPMHFITVAPDGTIWGGPPFGQTVFWMDPKTGKYTNTSKVCDAGGEVYDATFMDGKVYLAAYVGGDVIEFDPKQPWDQWNNRNPRVIAHLTERGYIRPNAGIHVGADKKLYCGWLAAYGKYGGAVSITDPKTGTTDLIEDPLGEMGIGSLALDDKNAWVGTTRSANGLEASKEPAKFGVIDLASRKAEVIKEFPGAGGVNHLVYDAKSKRVVADVGGTIHLFDTAGRAWVTPAGELPKLTSSMLVGPGDGKAYYGSGATLVALDVGGGTAETVGTAPAKVDNVAVGKDGATYVTCGPDVYRVVRE